MSFRKIHIQNQPIIRAIDGLIDSVVKYKPNIITRPRRVKSNSACGIRGDS